jgi:hypothetical protein
MLQASTLALSSRPSRAIPLSISEAYLHIRPSEYCGTRNCSIIYKAEIEPPRWALVNEDTICDDSLEAALEAEL